MTRNARGWVYGLIAALLMSGLSVLIGYSFGLVSQLIFLLFGPPVGAFAYEWGFRRDE